MIIEKNDALSKARQTYQTKAAELTKLRKAAAIHFEKALETELQALNMKATTFKIEIETSKNALQTGMDEVDFVISTNIGQPFRPLKKVVSGGELLMQMRLALWGEF